MGRLSEIERGQIVGARLAVTKIAILLGVSRGTVMSA
jgi:hypothetical protein